MLPLAGLLFLASIVFSMLGQGGGLLYTPLQVWSGIDFHMAASTSLFLIMITSFSSTLVFKKSGKVDWSLALLLESTTTLGSFVGGVSSDNFSGERLSFLFAATVAGAAFFMLREVKGNRDCDRAPGTHWYQWRRERGDHSYCINLLVAAPVTFVAGLLSGLLGVGGGILKVPMMVLLFGIPMDIAVGSSAFMVGLTATGGFAGHLISGHFNWRSGLIFAVAVFIGGQIGSRVAVKLDRSKMKKGFGYFLLFVSAMMIWKAF